MARSDTQFKPGVPQPSKRGNRYACKYKDEYCDMMREYFSGEIYDDNGHRKSLFWFAEQIGVISETLYEWANIKDENGEYKYPRFRDTYLRAKEFTCQDIINGAIEGRYNANFSAFLLQCDYGRIPASKTEIKADANISGGVSITISDDD